jgi:hypothetical protein
MIELFSRNLVTPQFAVERHSMNIHKAQEQTLKSVILSLSKAWSRMTTLEKPVLTRRS